VIVEVLGCTSSGKSTLINSLMQERGALPLKVYRLNKGGFVRLILDDLVRLFYFVLYFREWSSLTPLLRVCLKRKDSWWMRINLFRNFVKKQGEYRLTQRRSKNDLVLLDEGCIHAFSNLFCHYDDQPDLIEAMRFISVIPMPDVLIRVLASEEEVVRRATERLDPPWPNLNNDQWRGIYRNTEVLYEEILEKSEGIPTIIVDSLDINIPKILDKLNKIYLGEKCNAS
jgi:deoxyadenosine/deoxycytidine kinase